MGAGGERQIGLTYLNIGRVSPTALVWMQNPQPARLLHVFEHVCNLENASGAILSIQTPDIEMGPFSASLDSFPWDRLGGGFSTVLEADTKLTVGIERIELGSIVITNSHSEVWEPGLPHAAKVQPEGWVELATVIQDFLVINAPPGSLPWDFSQVERGELSMPTSAILAPSLLNRAAEVSAEVLTGIGNADLKAALKGVKKLAGLGGGLTPAGDDFLLGVSYALWLIWPAEDAQHWMRAFAEAAIPRTTLLSGAWLKAGAAGEAVESWQDLVRSWLDEDRTRAQIALDRIVATGHTSGADALAGFSATIKLGSTPL